MSAATIIALLTSVITAPVLATMISFFKDRRKDKVAEDQLRVQALREVIDELRTEIGRLRDNIKELEEEIETLKHGGQGHKKPKP